MAEVTIQQAFNLAVQHHQAGRLKEAEQLYRQILAHQPDHADALHMLAIVAHQVGQYDMALDLFRKAIAVNPNLAQAHCNLGVTLKAQGQLDQAMAAWRQAIVLQPDLAEAHNNLGLCLHDKGQLDQAIAAYRQAVALRPNYCDAYYNLGIALQAKQLWDQAIAAFGQAIAIKPEYAQAQYHLGVALQANGQLDRAIAAYRQAITLQPDNAEPYNNLGCALKDKGQLDEAVAVWQQAIVLKPDYPQVHNNLGGVLKDRGQLDQAIAAFRQAIALKHNFSEAYYNLGNALKEAGQLDQAIAAWRQAITLEPNFLRAHNNLVFCMHYLPNFDAAAIAQELYRWNLQHAEPLKKYIQPHANDRNSDRCLRIGYVSLDLGDHPIGWFMRPLLENHDHRCIEVFIYAQPPVPDDTMAQRLGAHTDAWRGILGLSDAQAAEVIRQDRIDILVDLSLHTVRNRLLTFARKPAPVQLTFLAYAGSSGLTTMDYRLSDPYLDPPGMDESIYSEKTFRLPETFWCYRPVVEISLQPPPALERDFVTFGCLNNFSKVNEPLLSLWAKLLGAVPHSRLLLHALEGNQRRQVLTHLQREGVHPQRVSFAGRVSRKAYFEQYQSFDIALDTFPYGGGTTTCDTLWMGVPVVSLVGQTAVSRAGLSILSNVGLPELVAYTADEYVQIAMKWAHDLPRLQQLRSTLRQRMQQSPLMDAPRFARNIESAYRQMWHKWCACGSLSASLATMLPALDTGQ